MSSTLSPISTYLSIVKDEPAAVLKMVESDKTVDRTVDAFAADSVDIASPTDLLASKNQAALAVVLGAYNMSGQSTETGLLRKLLTQDPSVSGSLVRSLGSADDLNFVQAMSDRSTVSIGFGAPTAASLATGGGTASAISFNNLAWSSADSALTAASPATSWSYVLDDGSASASIAAALTTALQSTGTTADPVTASYSVDATTGAIVGSSGAPAITTSTDSGGNTVYGIALATSSSGAVVRSANVVAVNASTAAVTPATATPLLAAAMQATGFDVSANASGTLSITNPLSNGTLSLSTDSYTKYVGTTPSAVSTGQNILSLGRAGLGLAAGDVLTSGGSEIGTVKSVDAVGNVTLAANASTPLAAGAEIDVAIGAGVSNVGTSVAPTSAAAAGSTTLALGSGAAGLQAGQILTDGSSVLGVVRSVDRFGNVTLQAGLTAAVTAGQALTAIPNVANAQTSALSDQSNVDTIITNYETNQYESQEDKQIPGMGDALYFTRTMPTITSINQLMSDPRLLAVITTNLGISSTSYGELSFTQQQALITSKVNLASLSKPATLQHYVEQYLALSTTKIPTGSADANDAEALFSGQEQAAEDASTPDTDGGTGLLSALYPTSNSGIGVLSALYPSATSDDGLSSVLSAIYA